MKLISSVVKPKAIRHSVKDLGKRISSTNCLNHLHPVSSNLVLMISYWYCAICEFRRVHNFCNAVVDKELDVSR